MIEKSLAGRHGREVVEAGVGHLGTLCHCVIELKVGSTQGGDCLVTQRDGERDSERERGKGYVGRRRGRQKERERDKERGGGIERGIEREIEEK